jgi:hypothetical protein
MHVVPSAGWYRYHCRRDAGGCGRIAIGSAAEIEAWVRRQLLEYLASNPKVAAAIEAEDPERLRLEEGRRRARRAMDEAVVLKRDDDIDLVTFRELHSAAKARFATFQAAIDALPVPETDVPDVDAIRHRWDQLSLTRQRVALAHYIDAVTVGPAVENPRDAEERFARRVTITWKR